MRIEETKEHRQKRQKIGKIFGREGKADLGRGVQSTQIGGGKVFQLRLVVEIFRCANRLARQM